MTKQSHMTPETKAHLLKMEGERISQRSMQGPQGGDEIKENNHQRITEVQVVFRQTAVTF